MQTISLKVGELAQRTGVSVRALHHYDEIGLLVPSQRTASGHRLYTAGDVARLQQIRSLQQLGFSLEEVRACLDGADFSPLRVVELHLARLREQLKLQQQLREHLEGLARFLRSAEEVSVEQFLKLIEVMGMIEKYYTPEQLEKLRERGRQVGEARIREVEAEWPVLISQVRAEMERGTDPASPAVQELARRWRGLVNEFTGGDPEIERAVGNLWKQEPNLAASHGLPLDQPLFDYVGKAIALLPKE